jgi:hypothetical protein
LKVVPRLKFLPFTRKKDALLQQADLRDVFKLVPSVSVCLYTSTILSPDDPYSADEVDIQMEYFSI